MKKKAKSNPLVELRTSEIRGLVFAIDMAIDRFVDLYEHSTPKLRADGAEQIQEWRALKRILKQAL